MADVIIKLNSEENYITIEQGDNSVGGHQKGSLSYRTSGDTVTIMNVYNTAVPYTHYAMFVCDGVSCDTLDKLVDWMDANFFRDASGGGSGGGGSDELITRIVVTPNPDQDITAEFDGGGNSTLRKKGVIVCNVDADDFELGAGDNVELFNISAGGLPALPEGEKYYTSCNFNLAYLDSYFTGYFILTSTDGYNKIGDVDGKLDCVIVNISSTTKKVKGTFAIAYDIDIYVGEII